MTDSSRWCNNYDDTVEFVAYLIASVPDDFPEEDDLDLDKAYFELLHGLACTSDEMNEAQLAHARTLAQRSYDEFKSGEVRKGRFTIQELHHYLMRLP